MVSPTFNVLLVGIRIDEIAIEVVEVEVYAELCHMLKPFKLPILDHDLLSSVPVT